MVPRVSVVLPVRNGDPYLEPALASIAAQTFEDFEVVIQDDGSTDGTRAVADAFAARDDRFRVESSPTGQGVAAAANRAAARARGDLLVRMDGDDLCRTTRLEKLVELADAEPETGLFASRARYFPPENVGPGMRRYEAWLDSRLTHDEIFEDRFVEYPLPHPTTMIRAPLFAELGGYAHGDFPEDYEFFLRAAAAGVRFAKHPDVLLDWREGDHRTTKRDTRYHLDAFRTAKCRHLVPHLRALGRPLAIVGAGPDGKRWAEALIEAGIAPRWFVDLHPSRRGQEIRGARVLGYDDLDQAIGAFLLSAVGRPGGRGEVREALTAAGFTEETDFLCVQ